jgi:exosome complex component RRP4
VHENKLCRYQGEVGDLVVGRIVSVDSKRWKVDINGLREAILSLSSINLASGEQRMKTYEDQLSMRTLFQEGDLISAEIQNINADGMVALHSRSLKYGKLENGQLVTVPSVLVKRLPQHYLSLPFGVDVILGKNGNIWITRSMPESWKHESEDMQDDIAPLAETLQRLRTRHNESPLSTGDRLKVVRVRNSILAICQGGGISSSGTITSAEAATNGVESSSKHLSISPDNIVSVYQKSIELQMQPKV